MPDEEKIDTPQPPSYLPAALQAKWKVVYVAAFKEAQTDFPNDGPAQRQAAHREANRLVRVRPPASYDKANKLADWQVVQRKEVDGVLKIVTIDGKKYSFDVPEPKREANPPNRGENGTGGQAPPPAA